ncbi:MAG: tRNA pseudouridine(38-40) synthase TruA [Candidatus Omnitrophota bacterium]
MRNIKLTISYDGTDFNGWQVQPNGRTVQEEVEKAIGKVFGKPHRLYAASRTDAGVHAERQVANFKTGLSSTIPTGKIPAALNAYLPDEVAIKSAEEVPPGFHSRFDAKSKHYRYYIINSRQRDPFGEKYTWRVPYELDVSLMKKEAKVLVGRHDFKSFQAKDKRERHSVRRIFYINVAKKKSFLTIDIEADGFLFNMVRNIMGTLVDIGRGYLPGGSMRSILKKKDRTQAGPTAPPKGLFLVDVKY